MKPRPSPGEPSLDALLSAAVIGVAAALREEEFVGTVEVGDLAWDVYAHPLRKGALRHLHSRSGKPFEDVVTMAVRMERGNAVVGAFLPGRVSIAEVARRLYEAEAEA